MNPSYQPHSSSPYAQQEIYRSAGKAPVAARAKFIERTYLHLAGAIGAFVGLEAVLLNIPGVEAFTFNLLGASQYSWLAVLGAFLLVSFIADRMARSATSKATQYFGLALYVLIEAVIFVPLLLIAQNVASATGDNIIFTAAVSTLAIFAALTGFVLYTKKDFSWLRGVLVIGGLSSLGIITGAIVFGFQLGAIFTIAMIAFAACFILYDTSNVLHHYRTDQHVSAALALFASVALMFWYVLRLLISLAGRE